ncbi:MAG: CRTAC1 family protein [Steroidobacteraceae bacterium]|nr:CRTAC1 family protein [Steroidobacteraceae bacterium]
MRGLGRVLRFWGGGRPDGAGRRRLPRALAAAGACLVLTGGADAAQPPAIRFVDEARKRGVEDLAVNSTGPTFGDYDGDGDLDLFVPVEDLAPGLADRLYENDGRGMFRDVAAERGVQNPGSINRGAVFCDFDNDGDLDLLAANLPPGQPRERHVPTTLFRNQLKESGQARFENVTRAAKLMRAGNANDEKIGGIGDTAGGVGCADYDRDGDLDVFWKNADPEIENALFRNEGNWTFTDVTASAGVAVQAKLRESNAQGSPNWTDVDQDGWIDLLVTNEGDSKVLLRNKGDGTFEDITRGRRPPSGLPFLNPGNAEGACIADFDNDGDMDFYLPLADQANRLILSRLKEKGTLTFEDVTLKSGAGDTGGARGCAVADFDNDGHVDLYVNNGGPSNTLINDVIAGFPPFVQFYIAWEPAQNALLRNNGDGTFSDVTRGSGAEGLGIGSGVGAADVDGDGFVDLFVANRTYYAEGKQVSPQPGQNRLYVNRGNRNNWIKVKLVGTRSNRNAYGAMIKVTAGDLVQYHETQSAHGYNSTSDPVITFGLGARKAVDAIEVRWPSGSTQVVQAPKVRGVVEIVEAAP